MNGRDDVRAAARVIRSGGVAAYPTEACFGLGCDPRNLRAVVRILRIKRRRYDQGLILIASDVRQLSAYVDPRAEAPLARARATWPGPYTWLLPAHPVFVWHTMHRPEFGSLGSTRRNIAGSSR